MQANLGNAPVTLEEFLETAIAKNIITAYTGLKKLWYQSLISMENEQIRMLKYTTDNGFLNWLSLQEENPIVFKILDESNLDFKFFLPDFEKQKGEQAGKEDGEKTFKGYTGNNVEIIEIESIDINTKKWRLC